jgi:hypothetical protein
MCELIKRRTKQCTHSDILFALACFLLVWLWMNCTLGKINIDEFLSTFQGKWKRLWRNFGYPLLYISIASNLYIYIYNLVSCLKSDAKKLFFLLKGPAADAYGRTAAVRLIVQTCDEDY